MTTVAKGDAAVRGGGRLAWGEAWRYARLGGREEALRRGLIVPEVRGTSLVGVRPTNWWVGPLVMSP